MATYLFGTGFEPGTVPFLAADQSASGVSVDGAQPHTGTYALKLLPVGAVTAWVRRAIAGALSELYVAAWVYPTASHAGLVRIQVILSDGKIIDVRLAGSHWNAYVDNVLVATGAYDLPSLAAYHRLELHVLIADVGRIQTKINGVLDIDYSGDTKPAAAADIAYVYLYNDGTNTDPVYLDDLTICTGGWPGDVRYDGIVVTADGTPIQWTPWAGANFECVNEVPASDADYVSAALTGKQDLYLVAAWPGTAKVPLFLAQWHRASKEDADADQLKQLLKSGAVLSTGAAQDLVNGTPAYAYRLLSADPATGLPWLLAGVQAVQVGQESVIA